MRKSDIPVHTLVEMIQRGELRLPEMQRQYVWRAARVRDLLDSLYRGYPSGSILVWESDEPQPTRDLSVAQERSPFSGHKLLLDGQQRLTSLSAVLRGEPVSVRGRKRPIEILFNLEHPDRFEHDDFTEVDADQASPLFDDDDAEDRDDTDPEDGPLSALESVRRRTFVVANKAIAARPEWVSVTRVFAEPDASILGDAGVTSLTDPRFAKYSARLQRLRKIRDYQFVMNVLERDLSYEEVAEIFVRVNSLGAKLRGTDLALAQITARWRDSLKLLEEFQDECEESWFTFDLGLLVRAMVVFATGQSRFKSLGNVPVESLKQGWEKAKRGLRFAINYLRTNAKIEDESLLSSPLFVITLAYYAVHHNERLTAKDERMLLHWLLVANARGRYSSTSETRLDADLAMIRRGGGPAELTKVVEQQFGRLRFNADDFVERKARSALFSLVYLALKARGARDWSTGLGISLAHQGRLHYIQFHHIFPKAILKGRYEPRNIHEIANLAFLSGGTNRSLGKKSPDRYFPEIRERFGDEALQQQAVPTDPEMHQLENFLGFIERRRALLADAVNQHLDSVCDLDALELAR